MVTWLMIVNKTKRNQSKKKNKTKQTKLKNMCVVGVYSVIISLLPSYTKKWVFIQGGYANLESSYDYRLRLQKQTKKKKI